MYVLRSPESARKLCEGSNILHLITLTASVSIFDYKSFLISLVFNQWTLLERSLKLYTQERP